MWTTPAGEEPDSFMVGGVSQNILKGIHPAIYRGGGLLAKKVKNIIDKFKNRVDKIIKGDESNG